MDNQERKLARFRAGAQAMPAEERRALKAAMEYAKSNRELWELVTDIAAALGRALQKRHSNERTEPRRRRLVGAQMGIPEANRCKACAGLLGVSQYRFVVEAMARECRMVEAAHGLIWTGEYHQTVTRPPFCDTLVEER